MSDNEASVKITADASAVAPATEEAKAQIAGIEPLLQQLNASFGELAAEIRASMQQGAVAAEAMAAEMHQLEEETERETMSLREMALAVHEGVESFNGFKAGLSEIAEVWMAAFAVEKVADWAKEFAESSERVEHLAQTFGMTSAQVQQLNGIATATGISLETITRGMAAMDRGAVNSAGSTSAMANAFKAVGISANDGMSQMERLEAVAEKFKDMDDGPKKAALAMELFGRSGAQLIPILNLGKEGLEELTAKATEYSAANTELSDSAQKSGVALAESINEGSLAWKGITNVLGDAFAPVLKEIVDSLSEVAKAFIDSYTQGGTVAVVFGAIRDVVEVVGAAINALAGIFGELWSVIAEVVSAIAGSVLGLFGVQLPQAGNVAAGAINIVKDAFIVLRDAVTIVIEIIRGHIEVAVGFLQAFAAVAHDAFTLQWDKIAGDWQAGMDKMASIVEQTGQRIANAANQIGQALDAAWNGQALGGEAHGVETQHGGSGGFDPTLGATKEKDDLVQKLDEQLKAKEVAWAMQQDAQNSAQEYSLQSVAEYWKQALERDDLSQKDRLAIEEKYLAAHSALLKQDIAKVVEGFQTQLEAAKGNTSQRLAIAQAEADFLKQKYGEDSKEYEAAQKQIVKIKGEAVEQVRQLAAEATKEAEKQANDELAAQEAAAKFRVSMGLETQQQLLAQEQQFEDAKFAIAQEALQHQQSLTDPIRDPVKYAQVSNQIEDLEREHQAKLTQIQQQAALQRTQIERNAINQTSSVWASNMAKVITLQESLGSAIKSVYTGMVNVISNALEKVIEQWIERHLAALALKRTTQATDGVASVTSNAGVAASAAFASTAAIPIVGPELAPAAASAAMAATLAFAPLASASGGYDIPSGVNPLTQLHEEEMVLPASIANPIRSMIAGGGGANQNSPVPANDGDHFHYHDHTGTASAAQIIANRGALAKAMKMAHREGHFAGSQIKI